MIRILLTLIAFIMFLGSLFGQSENENLFIKAKKLSSKGKFEEAISILDRLIAIQPINDSLKSEALHAKGLSFYKLGRYQKAIKYYEEANEIRIKNREKLLLNLGRGYLNMGSAYLDVPAFKKAEENFDLAIGIFNDIYQNNPQDENIINKLITVYGLYGALNYNKGDYFAALNFTNKSLSLSEGEYPYNLKSILLHSLGNYNEAILIQEEIIKAYQDVEYPVPGKYLNNVAYFCLTKKDYQKVIEYGELAKEAFLKDLKGNYSDLLTKQYLFEIYTNLGLAYGLSGNRAASDEHLQLALKYGEEGWQAKKHPKLAENYQFAAEVALFYNENEKALRQANQGIECFGLKKRGKHFIVNDNRVEAKKKLLKCLAVKAQALTKIRQANEVSKEEYLKDAIIVYEQIDTVITQTRQRLQSKSSKFFMLAELQPIYEKAIATSLDLYELNGNSNYQELAYYFSSKNKALLLLDDLFENEVKTYSGIPDSLILMERKMQIEEVELSQRLQALGTDENNEGIKDLEEKLLALRRNRESLISNFEKSYPKYYELKYGFQDPITVNELQQQLPKNSMLVEYFVGDKHIFIFTISKNQLRHYRVSLPQNFKENCLRFRTLSSDLNEYNDDPFQQIGHQLYKILLEKPLANKEKGINRLIIIPNEELLLLSFDNLLTAPQSDAFLIKDYAISYAYSNQLLYGKHAKKAKQEELERFIGFGIEYDTITLNAIVRQQTDSVRGLSRLEYAVEEVQTIAELLGGKTILNQDATKKAFLDYAPNASILHMAMHGIIDEEIFNEAALVFSKLPDNEGYLLSSSDLYAMELNNDMAVLSACNTAYGTIQKGEGIRSLARAFSYSGCSSLVASLWLAPDRSSKDILIEFYENLDKGMAKDVALQKAKLTYLNSDEPDVYKKPMFWSHLMVFGDTMPINKSFNWMYVLVGLLVLIAGYFLLRRRNA